MCEPTHSINQFPPDDPGGSNQSFAKAVESKPKSWFKRILDWFHFSAMGHGHSEAIHAIGMVDAWRTPAFNRYEANWWDRTVEVDTYSTYELDREMALRAAKEYAQRVSIGSLHGLRSFLEVTLGSTTHIEQYLHGAIPRLLSPRGKQQFDSKIGYLRRRDPDYQTKLAKITCGLTRRRENLCHAWADDGALWVPNKELLV